MKNIMLIAFFLCHCFCFLALGQDDYLKTANNYFDAGDYENAKRYYQAVEKQVGGNMSVQIKKSEDCYLSFNMAEEYFNDKDYEKARDRYRRVLDLNPKDTKTKRKYDECVTLLTRSTTARFANYTETTNNLNLEMIAVQGGTFMMGCTSEQGNDCNYDEKPAHRVTVSDYYIGKYEVTQAQWKAIMGNNPSTFKGDNLPVETVSWNDVQEFIRKLNAQTGKNYRLSTEAEWEFAARGGNGSKGNKYSGSNTASNVAWLAENSNNTTHPVGTKSSNELGIYDMSGNVWEWCSDWYGEYNSSAQTDPHGASSGPNRVNRGGSWHHGAIYTRISFRGHYWPDFRFDYLGFRLARSSK